MAIAAVLYALLAVLVTWFLSRWRGRSFDDLLTAREAEHHHVHRVLVAHPRGGTYRQFRRWMEEAA